MYPGALSLRRALPSPSTSNPTRFARAARSLPRSPHVSSSTSLPTATKHRSLFHPTRCNSHLPMLSDSGRGAPPEGASDAFLPYRGKLDGAAAPYSRTPVLSGAGPTATTTSGWASVSRCTASSHAVRSASSSGAAPAVSSGTMAGGCGHTAAQTSTTGRYPCDPCGRFSARMLERCAARALARK
jgi:hypothetical protein